MSTKSLRVICAECIMIAEISDQAKIEMLKFVNEADQYQLENLLLNSKIETLKEDVQEIVHDRFKASVFNEAFVKEGPISWVKDILKKNKGGENADVNNLGGPGSYSQFQRDKEEATKANKTIKGKITNKAKRAYDAAERMAKQGKEEVSKHKVGYGMAAVGTVAAAYALKKLFDRYQAKKNGCLKVSGKERKACMAAAKAAYDKQKEALKKHRGE